MSLMDLSSPTAQGTHKSQKWQKALVRVRIKAAHRHWNQAGTETSPQKGPETSQVSGTDTFADLNCRDVTARVC